VVNTELYKGVDWPPHLRDYYAAALRFHSGLGLLREEASNETTA
jgi:hypothetical protein